MSTIELPRVSARKYGDTQQPRMTVRRVLDWIIDNGNELTVIDMAVQGIDLLDMAQDNLGTE